MLHIPKTSPDCYVSSIVALNIHNDNGTGDWHSAYALSDNAYPEDFYIYGEGRENNTSHLLGNVGIIDGTKYLNEMGYFPKNTPVWIATHPRACVDYLYYNVLKTGLIERVILEEWFSSKKDKEDVYNLIYKMELKLTDKKFEILQLWKNKNQII